jgi:hypothetical protein
VDRAQKELNIEKQIKKIEDTWAVLALLFTPLADSDIMCLQVRQCNQQGRLHTLLQFTWTLACSAVVLPDVWTTWLVVYNVAILYGSLFDAALAHLHALLLLRRWRMPSLRHWRTTTCSCRT